MDSFRRLIDGLVRIYGTEARLAEALNVPEEDVRRLPEISPRPESDIAVKFAEVLSHIHRREVAAWDRELRYTRDATAWESARAHLYSTGAADAGKQFSPRRVGAEFS